jgi:hypothetical protein
LREQKIVSGYGGALRLIHYAKFEIRFEAAPRSRALRH